MEEKIPTFLFDFYTNNNLQCDSQNKAQMICTNPKCKDKVFICLDQSCKTCAKFHQTCQLNRLKPFMKKFAKKHLVLTPQLKKSYQALQKIYQEIIKTIQSYKKQLIEKVNYLGYKDKDIQFIKLIQNNKQKQVKGQLIFQVKNNIQEKSQLNPFAQRIMYVWQKFWKFDIQRHLDNMKTISENMNQIKVNSKLINNMEQIEQFFDKKCFSKVQLLYRASENRFSIQKFHQKCDDKNQLLTVAKTNFNKIIGAYCSIQWDSSDSNYQDGEAFLFSITNKTKLNPTSKGNQNVSCQSDNGPKFGNQQFWITDESNRNQCYFTVGDEYNTFERKYNRNVVNDFSGKTQADQQLFVVQWEVFQIQFY